MYGGNFHLNRDGRCARIQCPPKDVRETQNVVDLIGVIRAAGGNDGVVTHGFDVVGGDLGIRVGEGKNNRLGRHFSDHVLFEYTTSRQA